MIPGLKRLPRVRVLLPKATEGFQSDNAHE